MSDFSELCPLFNIGVFGEVTFPHLYNLTGLQVTTNMLAGDRTADQHEGFTFGRTVVVTEAFLRRWTFTADSSNNQPMLMRLAIRNTAAAVKTNFASLTITTTTSIMSYLTWNAMTVTDQTFTSDAVLDFGLATITETAIGCYDLIVRYKEA